MAVLGVLRNAFVKAVPTDTDGTVTFADAIDAYRKYLVSEESESASGNKKEEKKEERKEKRKEKREERRKERQAKREARQS